MLVHIFIEIIARRISGSLFCAQVLLWVSLLTGNVTQHVYVVSTVAGCLIALMTLLRLLGQLCPCVPGPSD